MPTINFPSNPSPGDIYQFNGVAWLFNGRGWVPTSMPPSGVIYTDDAPLTKRVEFVGTLVYKGEAEVGSAESDPVWRIHRLTVTDTDVIEIWADGVASFTKVWSDRLTYTYS